MVHTAEFFATAGWAWRLRKKRQCVLVDNLFPSFYRLQFVAFSGKPQLICSFFSHIHQPDWWKIQPEKPELPCLQKCNKSLKIQFWFCASVVGLPVLSLGILFFSRQASTNAVGSFHPPEQPSEKCLNNSNLSNVYFEMHPPSLPSSALQFLFIRRFIRAAPDTLTTSTADSK